jgi:predicted Zn-dependent protease
VKAWFDALADAVCTEGVCDRITLSVSSEESDFVRFNRGLVRQMTRVEQHQATLALLSGQRCAASRIGLSGNATQDIALLLGLRQQLAADLPMVPPDPYLRMPQTVTNTFRDDSGQANVYLPPLDQIVAQVVEQAAGLDLVGFFAAGPVLAAFADSRGQRNWHRIRSFHFDWSLYGSSDPAVRDRAVKSTYAGTRWDPAQFRRRMDLARARLALLQRPARKIAPGAYRVWLEPAAVAEILGMLAWGGFGIKERRTGTSSLLALENGEASLSPQFTLAEATAGGIAPAFTATGHVKPDAVALVTAGKAAQALVSPRSAAEFGLPASADEGEHPSSLSLAGGSLDTGAALAALDTGLWIGNLWYLGYSDRRNCRMTGMTRFASFQVERGELVAPIEAMRFDDSFLRLFGDGLLALSREVEFLPSGDTWGQRHLGSVNSPGALLADMRFTL